MAALNSVLRAVFDLIQYPLRGLSPLWGVLLWSVPVAIFALFVFKKTSNQERIAAVKKKIHACLFEIRLFNDDLRAILRAQLEIFRHVFTYQRYSLVPMVWILPPLVILMVHLHTYYGYRPLRPGDTALLKVQLTDGWRDAPSVSGQPSRPPVEIELPDGIVAETPAVWLEALNEVVWRVAVEQEGVLDDITVQLGEARYKKSVSTSSDVVRLGYERPDRNFWGQLEWPGEAPMPPDAPVSSIVLTYAPGSMDLLGFSFEWEFAWMVVFFVLTMVIAFALRKRMGVEF